MAILRKLPNLTVHKTLLQSYSQGQGFYLLGLKTLCSQWLQWANTSFLTLYIPQSHSQTRFPQQFDPRFPLKESQMSHSVNKYIQGAVTPKQPKLVPLRRNQQQSTPLAFIPFQVFSPLQSPSAHPPSLSTSLCALCYEEGWQSIASQNSSCSAHCSCTTGIPQQPHARATPLEKRTTSMLPTVSNETDALL